MELKVLVHFTDNIRPICLPYTGINTQYYNHTGTIAGWGVTTEAKFAHGGTKLLKEADTMIIDTDICGKLIHIMGKHAWRQSPSGNSISR